MTKISVKKRQNIEISLKVVYPFSMYAINDANLIRKTNTTRELTNWYQNPMRRKNPFVLFGARQTGKSTIIKNFAKETNRDIIEINFWKDEKEQFKEIFHKKTHAKKIISKLEILFDRKIDEEKSILLLDEIQEAPATYSLFKSFKEDTSLPVLATGSYLKLFLNQNVEFEIPVGCTEEHLLTPLTFSEYLLNANKQLYNVFEKINLCESNNEAIDEFYHKEFLKYYYEYLFVGGMPAAASAFLAKKNSSLREAINDTRNIQEQLLDGYKKDFLKMAAEKKAINANAEKLALLFDLIPKELMQYRELEQPVQRFKFSSLGNNIKYSRVSNNFEYLSLTGFIIKSTVVSNIDFPLINNNNDKNAFKCFFFDVGLMQAALKIPYQKIIDDELSMYKGPIAENFIAQQLYAKLEEDLYSWKPNNHQEIEFIFPSSLSTSTITAIEVKASKKSSPSSSVSRFINENQNGKQNARAIKVAPRNFGFSNNVLNMPIYLIEKLFH